MAQKVRWILEVDSATGQANLKRFAGAVDKGTASLKKQKVVASGLSSAHDRLTKSLALVGGAYGIFKVAKGFVDAASSMELYRITLSSAMRSVEEGNRLFNSMADYASRVPFEYAEIMESATALSGVMGGSRAEIEKWIPLIGDLSAYTKSMGLSFQDTAMQVARMYSGGAAAADQFRDRGISAMLGFSKGVEYSVEETRKKLFEAWTAADTQFGGLAKKMSDTWTGQLSMMADKWLYFQLQVMEGAGVFDELKVYLKEVNKQFEDWIKNNEAVLKQKIPEYVKEVTESIKSMYKFYSILPDDVVGAAGIGLVGRILFGKYGLLLGALYFINQKIKDLNAGIDSLFGKIPKIPSWKELWKAEREGRSVMEPAWEGKVIRHKRPEKAPPPPTVPGLPPPSKEEETTKERESILKQANEYYKRITLSETEFETYQLNERLKTFKNAGFSKKKISEILYLETHRMATEAHKGELDLYNEAVKAYEEMNLSRTDIEKRELEAQVTQWVSAGFDKIKAEEYIQSELTRIDYEANEERRRTLEGFREEDRRLGMTDYELKLVGLKDRVTARAEAGMSIIELANYEAMELRRINKETADKLVETDREAMMKRLEFAQSTAGGIADTFRMMSQAGGRQSAKAFRVYQAFSIVEATIAAHAAAAKALASPPGPPWSFIMAGIALAQGLMRVALIASARPPSYAEGGISTRPEYAMVGEKGPEAHIPLKSGSVPVVMSSPQEFTIVNVTDASMLDAYFASSRGQDAIVNVISSRGSSIRRILR